MKGAQLEFNWQDKANDGRAGEVLPQVNVLAAESPKNHTLREVAPTPPDQVRYWVRESDGLPIAWPEPEAIEAGEFGMSPDGPIVPDSHQIITLTEEVANAFVSCLCELSRLEEEYEAELDVQSECKPSPEGERLKLRTSVLESIVEGLRCYSDSLGAYERAFGEPAALALDAWARNASMRERCRSSAYPPSHPWHYLACGDGVDPVPVCEIPAAVIRDQEFCYKLPKNPKKRAERLSQLLADERSHLEIDKQRYQEIVERGAEALSDYDRGIAHSTDETARASALALKYNHVSRGLGRIAWLEAQLDASLASSIRKI